MPKAKESKVWSSGECCLSPEEKLLALEAVRFFVETCDDLDVETLTRIARLTEKLGGQTNGDIE